MEVRRRLRRHNNCLERLQINRTLGGFVRIFASTPCASFHTILSDRLNLPFTVVIRILTLSKMDSIHARTYFSCAELSDALRLLMMASGSAGFLVEST
jgi:hypothetical protein